ncbi:MAG: hypothetical protein U5N85_17945 [Arcicella sp.]|nr:hypothetical protein [Arcicella sp.]
MNLFIYIQITNEPQEVKFQNPIAAFLEQPNHNLYLYDLDNHSDSFIIGNANKLIADSEKAIVYIETTPEGNFRNLVPLLTNFLDNPDHIQFIVQGNSPRLEKMLSILTYIKIPENTPTNHSIETIIKQFF